MDIPEALSYRIKLFRSSGRVAFEDRELFVEPNWLSVFIGQGIWPRRYDPLADMVPIDSARSQMSRLKGLDPPDGGGHAEPRGIHRGALPCPGSDCMMARIVVIAVDEA